jgi:hypothetical protein
MSEVDHQDMAADIIFLGASWWDASCQWETFRVCGHKVMPMWLDLALETEFLIILLYGLVFALKLYASQGQTQIRTQDFHP